MFNLILKDILIQKKYVFLSVLYAFFFAFMFKSTPFMLFVTVPIMVSYTLLLGCCAYDDKNKCEIMLNSLPIKRIDLVISKYVSTFIFIFIGLFLAFIVENLFNFSGFINFTRLMNLKDVLIATISILFFSSLYFPLYFKLGYQKSRYFLLTLFFAIFAIPTILSKTIANGSTPPSFMVYLNNQPDWLISTFIIIIAFIILLSSMLLSIKFYLNKDL